MLFVSGYTENTIAKSGVLGDGVELSAKPFSLDDLLERVARIIGADQLVE